MRQFLVSFWLLSRWSFEFLYMPPMVYLTLLLVLNVVVAALRQKPFGAAYWKQHYSWIIVQFLFLPATVAVAVIGWVDWEQVPFPGENYWGLRATDVFALGSFLTGTYWVWQMRGFRWFAAALAVLQVWVLAGAQFVAGMALTGRWL